MSEGQSNTGTGPTASEDAGNKAAVQHPAVNSPTPSPDPAAVGQNPPPINQRPTFREEWAGLSHFNRVSLLGLMAGLLIGLGAWLWPAPLSDTGPILPPAFAAERNLNDDQVQQILNAITDLKAKAPEEGISKSDIDTALETLRGGDVEQARSLFQQIYDTRAKDAAAARKDQAEAARNLAAISVVDNKAEALALYREATTLDPTNADGWLGLADSALYSGTLLEAERAATRFLGLQKDTASRSYGIGLDRIGDIRTAQGNLSGALEAYQASLDIRDALAKADPNNTEWQRDLSVSHDRIGNIRTAQGNLSGALQAYQASLDIRDALAKADPHNSLWQRDLSISHNKIGDIRTAQGNLSGALDAYQAGLDIADALAKADPNNTEWQRDLSISHDRIGDIRTAQGNLASALQAYQASLDIRDALAKADPHNTQWQRDLSISHDRIGDIRTAQGNLSGALEAYQASLDIRDALAKADPHNSLWQRDLSVSHDRIGDIRTAQGNLSGALQAYQASLDIADALAKADPHNTQWQRDLIVSHWRMAEAGGDAVSHYRQALDVAERLQAEGKLAPVDNWMVGELRDRLKAAEGE